MLQFCVSTLKHLIMNLKLLKIKQVFLSIAVFGTLQVVNAQNGLDPTFGNNGTVTTEFGNDGSLASNVLQLSDNSFVVVGGSYDSNEDDTDLAVAKYNEDGSLDTTFGVNGKLVFALSGKFIDAYDVKEDASGNLLIAAVLTEESDYTTMALLMRLTPSGATNTDFGTNGMVVTDFGSGLEAGAYALALQNDGKIVIAGATFDYTDPQYDELGDFALARYNANGSLDTTFGNNGYVVTAFNANYFDVPTSMQIQTDGKIVAAGYTGTEDPTTFEDSGDIAVARYNMNGSLDSSFGTNGKKVIDLVEFDFAIGMNFQTDGKILLVGDISGDENPEEDAFLIRLNTDGSMDTGFSTDGVIVIPDYPGADADGYSTASSVFQNTDGSIFVAGRANSNTSFTYTTITKYTADGNPDTAFRENGYFIFLEDDYDARKSIITTSGKLLTVGYKNDEEASQFGYDFYMAQFLLNNTLSVEDFQKDSVSIYPNPVTDRVQLDFTTAVANTQIALFDTLGKEIMTFQTDQKNTQLNMENLSQGIYYLKVTQNNNVFTKKIVKN